VKDQAERLLLTWSRLPMESHGQGSLSAMASGHKEKAQRDYGSAGLSLLALKI